MRQVGMLGSGFCRDAGGGAQGGTGQTVELGAVHRLSDSDPATSPTCHRIPGHPSAHQKDTGSLGGGEAFDAGGGHALSMWGIHHSRPEGGDGAAPGTNIPQPGAPWEAPDDGAVDN